MQRDFYLMLQAIAESRAAEEAEMRARAEETRRAGHFDTATAMEAVADMFFPPRGKQEDVEGVPPRAGQEGK